MRALATRFRGLRPSRRTLAIGAVAAGALAVTAAFAAAGGDEPAETEADSGVPTVPLERRDLVARESVDGTLGFADEEAVINRLSGTFTWLPAAGDVIGRGARLFEVDGEPVVLMYGDVPAYRELAAGVADGSDVKALEANLAELGYTAGGSMSVDDEFTSATAEAVSDWQDDLGLEETGAVELGRVVFMPGPRRVTGLEVSLGQDAGSGAGGDLGATASAGEGATLLAAYQEPEDEAAAKEDQKPDNGKKDEPAGGRNPGAGRKPTPAVEQPSAAQQAPAQGAGPSQSRDGESEGGTGTESGSAASTEVMSTTSERRIVTVELDPADGELVKRGGRAVVALPDGEEVKARIASVGTVAEDESAAAGGEEESDPTIEVTIALERGAKASGLDQAPVTVELDDEVRRDVFAVPVEALLGTAGEEFAIVVRDGSESRQIPVEPGLFADGYVEIEGGGLNAGLRVEVPGE